MYIVKLTYLLLVGGGVVVLRVAHRNSDKYMKYYFISHLSYAKYLYFFIYYILTLYRGLPAGISHLSPENPSAQLHTGAFFAPTVQVPPFWHGLGSQTK